MRTAEFDSATCVRIVKDEYEKASKILKDNYNKTVCSFIREKLLEIIREEEKKQKKVKKGSMQNGFSKAID